MDKRRRRIGNANRMNYTHTFQGRNIENGVGTNKKFSGSGETHGENINLPPAWGPRRLRNPCTFLTAALDFLTSADSIQFRH